jgi:hypothetical protein
MTRHTLTINRAPVLTLWATLVAERLGYAREEALTLGKAVAGLNAQSKGRRLGIFAAPAGKPAVKKAGETAPAKPAAAKTVELMGRAIPVARTKDGVRAVVHGKPTDPASVGRYLEQKFGDAYDDATAALKALARARQPRALAQDAFALYEAFRPAIPAGQRGWGAKGVLDLDHVRALAKGEDT